MVLSWIFLLDRPRVWIKEVDHIGNDDGGSWVCMMLCPDSGYSEDIFCCSTVIVVDPWVVFLISSYF